MTPEAREAARLVCENKELLTAARNYYPCSEITNLERESVQAAIRLGDLLDADNNRKEPSQ